MQLFSLNRIASKVRKKSFFLYHRQQSSKVCTFFPQALQVMIVFSSSRWYFSEVQLSWSWFFWHSAVNPFFSLDTPSKEDCNFFIYCRGLLRDMFCVIRFPTVVEPLRGEEAFCFLSCKLPGKNQSSRFYRESSKYRAHERYETWTAQIRWSS